MTGTTNRAGADGALLRGPESTLSAALAELDDGCGVLVTGDVPDDAYRAAASRYFGVPDRDRRRVLALTRDPADAAGWLPDGVAPGDDGVAVRRLPGAVREPTAAADASAPEPDGQTDTGLPGDGEPGGRTSPARLDLDGDGESPEAAAADARSTLSGAIDAVADGEAGGRLRLRVGVYRIDTLCAALGEERARPLLRDVAETTRERGGMAHFHLPRPAEGDPRSDPVVGAVADALGDALDAIVELRTRERSSVPEERWHILEWGRTDWNSLR
ncbi:hypothetical protein BRC97_01225 [Halobacteriales archaeon QS_6_71_20]|nr:MAG: hypothetical protein BRC97_01225 [Halobacteriales archaeon QS_6_71_20]